jgi:hypothetical protein
VDLGDGKGGEPPAKRSNSSLLEGTVYAIGALGYMEQYKEDVARRET